MLRKKHQRLVEAAMPAGGEATLHSGNLSTLIFYANARPSKLVKVAAYLRQRIDKEQRAVHVDSMRQYLRILDALVEGCLPHLALFSGDVLGVIQSVLAAGSLPDAQLVTLTLVRFASAPLVGTTSVLEARHRDCLELLQQHYYKLAMSTASDTARRSLSRTVGLFGLFTVVLSLDLRVATNRAAIARIAPHLFDNLSANAVSAVVPPRVESPGAAAVAIIEAFCRRANAATLEWLLTPALDWLEHTEQWSAPWPGIPDVCLLAMQRSLPRPLRPVLLVYILARYDQLATRSPAVGAAGLAHMLHTVAALLSLSDPPLGATCLHALDIAATHLLSRDTDPVLRQAASALLDALVSGDHVALIKHAAIADLLARVSENTRQADDLVQVLDIALRLARAGTEGASPSAAVITTQPSGTSALSLVLPSALVDPLLRLTSHDMAPVVRARALEVLYELLRGLADAAPTESATELRQRTLALFREQHGRMLAACLLAVLQDEEAGPAHAVAVLKIMRLLLRTAVHESTLEAELALSLPVLVTLHRSADAGGSKTARRRRAVVFALALSYLEAVAAATSCAPLAKLTERLREQSPQSVLAPSGVELKHRSSIGKLSRLGSFKELEKKASKKKKKTVKKERGASSPATPSTPATPTTPSADVLDEQPPPIDWSAVYEALSTVPGVRRNMIDGTIAFQSPAVVPVASEVRRPSALVAEVPAAIMRRPSVRAPQLTSAAALKSATESGEASSPATALPEIARGVGIEAILAYVAPRDASDDEQDETD